MEHLHKLRLVDEHGNPLSTRLDTVLGGLLQKFRRWFPAIQDETELTNVFEQAAHKIEKREQLAGPIGKLHAYAWVTLHSLGVSWMRRGSSQIEQQTVQNGETFLSALRAWAGSQEQIERDILLRQFEAGLTPDERLVFIYKKAGYSSEQIARRRGCSVGAVDVLFTRVKQKIRRLAGIQE